MITQKDFTYTIDKDLLHYNITYNTTNESINGVKSNNSISIEEEINSYINTQIMMINSKISIDELKHDYIQYSKDLLEEYLINNPIKSSVHNSEEKYYSVTSEKQVLLTKEILMCQMAQINNVEYTPSWNASGEIYSYDWSLEKLIQLSHEISTFVKPKILKQQLIEETIKNALTVEEIMSIDISYDN